MHPNPRNKKSYFFTFFMFDPMAAQVKIVKYLLLLDAHHVHPMTFLHLHMKKIRNYFHNHLWLTTHFLPLRAQIPKIKHGQPQLNNAWFDSHKLNTKIFLSTSYSL